jgi:dipeptidyl aminopeptidase/acylaminoacyl peptidase
MLRAQQTATTPPAAPKAAEAKVPVPKAPASFVLSIDNIMRGPKLVGGAPAAIRWAPDSSKIYFSWQTPSGDRPDTYSANRDGSGLTKLLPEDAKKVIAGLSGRVDPAGRRLLTVEGGNVVIYDRSAWMRRVLVKTAAMESNARWARRGNAVTFVRDGNLYLFALGGPGAETGETQLTDSSAALAGGPGAGPRGALSGTGPQTPPSRTGDTSISESQRILRDEEKKLIGFIKRQAEQREKGGDQGTGGRVGPEGPVGPPSGPAEPIARFQPGPRQMVTDMVLSADERFVYIGINERPDTPARSQDVPAFVTESAYPEMTGGRSNVGDSQSRRLLAILSLADSKVVWADGTAFAGKERTAKPTDPASARLLDWGVPECSDDGSHCVTTVRSADDKDRWFVTVDPATGKAAVLDAQHDDAWVMDGTVGTATGGMAGMFGGFGGGGGGVAWLPDNKRFMFAAEKDGWMHLYTLDVTAQVPAARQLTSGKWEVSRARLSNDRTRVYFAANAVHPGESQFYTMSVDGGQMTRVTTATGAHDVTVSPDEQTLAVVYSPISRPPELFVMPFKAGAPLAQVTTTPVPEWLAFKWIEPKIITYKARDGALVYARLYTPEMVGAKRDPRHPAVVFVHGAGYLQFATKSWSTYYREHMFHHLLASRGYVVICPDYRASSGYGRDWRTGIYQHMGGKDLEDVVDATKFIVATEKVNPKRIGVYGGSYGGFITLMAMFTTPDVFAAGAALRPVTDWAHYGHGYTAAILNTPQTDPDAYKRSSPIYFAEGLKGQLLICHGMVDSNVFFQDTVRLVQRLIELRKDHWSVAPYPVENHGFTEETSWADEYTRIFSLFEQHLKG